MLQNNATYSIINITKEDRHFRQKGRGFYDIGIIIIEYNGKSNHIYP